MPYTNYANDYVDSDGDPLPLVRVPKSCIQSTEDILKQIMHRNTGRRATRSSSMTATFSNWTFNASRDDFINNVPQGLSNYAFVGGLPSLGQGIVLIRKTPSEDDGVSNMHFGAVVARSATAAVITAVFQLESGEDSQQVPLEVMTINNAGEFAANTYGRGSSDFAIGLLTLA